MQNTADDDVRETFCDILQRMERSTLKYRRKGLGGVRGLCGEDQVSTSSPLYAHQSNKPADEPYTTLTIKKVHLFICDVVYAVHVLVSSSSYTAFGSLMMAVFGRSLRVTWPVPKQTQTSAQRTDRDQTPPHSPPSPQGGVDPG